MSSTLAVAQAPTGHEGHQAQLAAPRPEPSARVMSPQPALGDIRLVDQDGRATTLREALESDKPVLVNFIFTTCTTICPVMSAGMSQFLKNLGPQRDSVRVVSISIDPDNDTVARPARLRRALSRAAVVAVPDRHARGHRGSAAGLRQLSRRQEQSRGRDVRPAGGPRPLDRARRLLECRDAAARGPGPSRSDPKPMITARLIRASRPRAWHFLAMGTSVALLTLSPAVQAAAQPRLPTSPERPPAPRRVAQPKRPTCPRVRPPRRGGLRPASGSTCRAFRPAGPTSPRRWRETSMSRARRCRA